MEFQVELPHPSAAQFKLQQGYAVSNASNLCMNAELTIFNPLNTSLYKHYHYKSSQHYSSATGYWVTSTGGGYYDANTTALSGFTIFASFVKSQIGTWIRGYHGVKTVYRRRF